MVGLDDPFLLGVGNFSGANFSFREGKRKESLPKKSRPYVFFWKNGVERCGCWMFLDFCWGLKFTTRICWVVVGDEWWWWRWIFLRKRMDFVGWWKCLRFLEQEPWSLQMFEAGRNFQQSWQNHNSNFWNGRRDGTTDPCEPMMCSHH